MIIDETGWFYNGRRYWVWVFVSPDSIVYHLSSSRSKLVSESILQDFEGIMVSDSYSAWNDVGGEHQKCLLHYFRNMHNTLKKNHSNEFESFFWKLHKILKDAISTQEEYAAKVIPVPEHVIQALQDRINQLIEGTYRDADCNRFVKRLRKEGMHLLTFLKYGIDYHNNTSERALRIFATARKISYGSRSMSGLGTTETIASIAAMCERRGINPYKFFKDYLSGEIDDIPMSKVQMPIIA